MQLLLYIEYSLQLLSAGCGCLYMIQSYGILSPNIYIAIDLLLVISINI